MEKEAPMTIAVLLICQEVSLAQRKYEGKGEKSWFKRRK